MVAHKIDKAWFRTQMERIGYTQNEFARLLGIDRGAWSKTLAGIRKMTDAERVKAAKVFGVELHELLPHVGVPVHVPGARVEVRESVGKGYAAGSVGGIVEAPVGEVTFTPDGLLADQVLLVVQGDAFLDGWAVECRPAERSATPTREMEAAIVQLPDGRMLLRKVRAGFSPGRFDLGPVFGFGSQQNDVEIVGVVPVVGLKRL